MVYPYLRLHRVRTKGTLDPDAQMFLVNHQSDIDIGIIETITPKNIAWVAKRELFTIPFFGLVLRLPKILLCSVRVKQPLSTH